MGFPARAVRPQMPPDGAIRALAPLDWHKYFRLAERRMD